MEAKLEDIKEAKKVKEVEKQSEAEVEVEDKKYINIMYGSRNITDNDT